MVQIHRNLCLPPRVFVKGFAVISRVLQIGILRNELILSGHVKKACDKSMLLCGIQLVYGVDW